MDGDERRRSSASSGSRRRTTAAMASGSSTSRRPSGKEGGNSSSGSRSRRNEAAEHIAALLSSAASCKKPDIKGILVRPPPVSDHAEMSRNGKSRAGTTDSSENNEAYHNNPVLAPLLKLLPKHVDPSTLKTLLKGVHPSAFGSFKTKETWRKENPDILNNSSDDDRRAESCPAGCRGSSDDDGTCSYSYSPTGSLSSLADLDEHTIANEYDDTPSTSASPIPPLPSSISSSVSPPRYTSAYLATPQDLSLRRYRSNSSIASACTCNSASSRTSSIRFAPLPEEELQSRERKPQLSFAMGIAGRAKMLQGRKAPQDLSEDSVDEIFDPELRQIDAQFEEEEESDSRRGSDITLRYNQDGDIVEKRPLGVTLEELVFPVKKHRQQERGRSRATSDLSASFQRRSSSVDAISPPQTATSSPNKASDSSTSSPLSRHTSEDSSCSTYPTPTQTPKFADLSLEHTPIPTPRSTSPSIPNHSFGFTPISSPPRDAFLEQPIAAESPEEADADASPELDPCDSSSPSGSSPESPSSDSSDFEDEEVDDKVDSERLVTGDNIPLPQLLMAHNHLRKTANHVHARKVATGIKVSRGSTHRSGVSKKRT